MASSFISPQPTKKKRNRNTLTATCREERYAKASKVNGDWYLRDDQACDDSKELFMARSARGRKLANEYWRGFANMEPHEIGYDESSEFHAMGNGVSLIRMKAIEYAFIHIYRELCRGLDSYGFSDLTNSMLYHCALSTKYPVGDMRRVEMGTPNEVWRTMERCWEIEPTIERIVDDISALLHVLSRIINAEGCVVPDLFFRNGRRHRRADDMGDCERKPCVKQRIASNVARPCHPDCIDALNMLRAYDPQADADLEEDIENFIAMEEEAENTEGVEIHVDFDMDELMDNLNIE